MMKGRRIAWGILFIATACGGLAESSGPATGTPDAGHSLPPVPGARVYMSDDRDGDHPRDHFRTDTPAAYCIAELSAPRPGAIAAFTIRERGSDGRMFTRSVTLSSRTRVAFELPHVNALPLSVTTDGLLEGAECDGYCIQAGDGCTTDYVHQGTGSCGVGATCCYNVFNASGLPLPVGHFTCEVVVGAELAGQTDFDVAYPPSVDGEVCGQPQPLPPAPDSSVPGPVGPPYGGLVCAGWVPAGSTCKTCTCTGGFWVCP